MSGSDNPFREPDDDETVYFRPSPGGRPAPPLSEPAAPSWLSAPRPERSGAAAVVGEPIGVLSTGQSPLIEIATPLLQLLGRLGNTFSPPDPGALRTRTMQAVRDFETGCRAERIERETLDLARYALCASIDDVVMHMPWGTASTWQTVSLVSHFHRNVIGGERFFANLDHLKENPALNLDLLHLMYLCLSLGFQGQYRVKPYTPAQLERVRENLYQTIVAIRQPHEQGLSLHWKGEDAPYRPARALVPVWVMAVVTVAVVATTWLVLFIRLDRNSEPALQQAFAMPPTQMPRLERPPPPISIAKVQAPQAAPLPPNPVPVDSPAADALRRFLDQEIRTQQVVVWETPQMVEVRIFNSGMFATGSATVRPDFVTLLEKIGEALNTETGDVLVSGHTDNQPIFDPVPFPSNYQLSLARAQAASSVILHRMQDSHRLAFAGKADHQPIVPNDTDDHRAQNRRIDVVLQKGSR